MTNSSRIFNVFLYIVMGIVLIIMIYPLWYVLMYSLSDSSRITLNSYYLIPDGFTLENFGKVLSQKIIYNGFKNSFIVVSSGTVISLLVTATTAFPLSRKFVGKKIITLAILFTMIFYAGMIPTYLLVRSLHMTNTLWALILPLSISVYNLLVMKKFFEGIPESLFESAFIDGYNDIAVFVKIVLPLSKAVLAAIGLFYAVSYWNAFLPGMIYLTDRQKWPLQVALVNLLRAENMFEDELMMQATVSRDAFKMASVIVTLAPILLVYPFLQKHFVKGVMLGSVKG